MENETAVFLGSQFYWGNAQIRLEDVQPLYGGVRLWVASWGNPSVHRVAASGDVKRYKVPFNREEKLDLIQLFAEQDFLTIAPPERAGIPDEARPSITLINHKRETHTVSKWAGVQDARFDVIYDALLTVIERAKDVKPEPEKLRPFQKTLFILGLILLILSPFVIGNIFARLVVNLWWPAQIGKLTWILLAMALGHSRAAVCFVLARTGSTTSRATVYPSGFVGRLWYLPLFYHDWLVGSCAKGDDAALGRNGRGHGNVPRSSGCLQ